MTASDRLIPASDHLIPAPDHLMAASDRPIPASDHPIPASDPLIPASDHLIPAPDHLMAASDRPIPASDHPMARAAAHDTGWLTAVAAANLAAWHDLHLRALGHRTTWQDGLWLTTDRIPVIFFSAIAVRPGARGDLVASATSRTTWTAVSDPWSDLDLAGSGYDHLSDQPWMSRPAGPVEVAGPPDGLVIERVTDTADLVRFESTAAAGFEAGVVTPHTWHGPGVLTDSRLALWLGLVGGRPVAVSMGFREAGALGIYGVATIPAMRRRGLATAMTAHTIAQAPGLPAVLQPSTMAEPLYRGLGFRRFGAFRSWARGGG